MTGLITEKLKKKLDGWAYEDEKEEVKKKLDEGVIEHVEYRKRIVVRKVAWGKKGVVIVREVWGEESECCETMEKEVEKVRNGGRDWKEEVKWERVKMEEAMEEEGVREVPHLVIVDKEGKIAFSGHPAEIDLSSALETLLADKPLTLTLSTSLDGEPDLSGYNLIEPSQLPSYESSLHERAKLLSTAFRVDPADNFTKAEIAVLLNAKYSSSSDLYVEKV